MDRVFQVKVKGVDEMGSDKKSDPFERWFEKGWESLRDAQGAFDPETFRKIREHSKGIDRLYTETMAAFNNWLRTCSEKAPDPEASAQLRNTLLKLYMKFLKEFSSRYLNLPALGLARESQQNMLQAIDAHNKLMASLVEFFHDFSDPIFQSLGRLPEILGDKANGIESADDLYQTMRADLDRQYQAYLASPKGVLQVAGLVDGYLEFKRLFDDAIAPTLKFYGLPGKEEMTDIYRRLHRLKKNERDAQSRLKRQDEAIEALQQRVQDLQATASGASKSGNGLKKRSPAKKKAKTPGARQG